MTKDVARKLLTLSLFFWLLAHLLIGQAHDAIEAGAHQIHHVGPADNAVF